MKFIKDQIISGTEIDSQGEKLTIKDLDYLAEISNPRVNLGQRHDLSSDNIGYIENFRVVKSEKYSDEYFLIGDVYFNTDSIDEALNGFSFSLTKVIYGDASKEALSVFIPYPYYNKDDLLKDIYNNDSNIIVGKWIKKEADPLSIILILVNFLLKPVWDSVWKDKIYPILIKNINQINKLMNSTNKYNIIQICFNKYKFLVYFIPDNDNSPECYLGVKLSDAINRAFEFSKKYDNISKIKFLFDTPTKQYIPFMIELNNGEFINILR